MVSFSDLGIGPAIVKELNKQGITEPFEVQKESIPDSLLGRDVCCRAPTGSGKTLAAVMGPIARILSEQQQRQGIQLLYITPLRALSRDLTLAIREPVDDMGWPISVGTRNGDTTSSERTKQLNNPPNILMK